MSLVLCYATVVLVLVLVLVLLQSHRSCAQSWQLVAAAVRSNGSWWQQLLPAMAAAVRCDGSWWQQLFAVMAVSGRSSSQQWLGSSQ